MQNTKIKKYKKEFEYSYTIGAFPTMELLKNKPEAVLSLYLHSKLADSGMYEEICPDMQIIRNDKAFERVGVNDNSYVLGVFKKYTTGLDASGAHIVLVNPGDMGNLGTIIRTALGFGFKNIAIIKPAADIFDPKAVRASMGAVFRINHGYFNSFDEYAAGFPEHKMFPFMTRTNNIIQPGAVPEVKLFSLIFGSETSGLDEGFLSVGTPFSIAQSPEIDSHNLAVAVAIGAYGFAIANNPTGLIRK